VPDWYVQGLFYLVAMAIKTYTEQLESVQAAIDKIESGGQAYSIGGRSLTRADLPTLYAREKQLRALVDRENRGGGIRTRGVTPSW
jgi:hypothetical protein